MASDYISSNVHRREGYLAIVQIKPVLCTLLLCISAELLFPFCDSIAAPRAASLGAAIKYLRRKRAAPLAAAWGTTIKCL